MIAWCSSNAFFWWKEKSSCWREIVVALPIEWRWWRKPVGERKVFDVNVNGNVIFLVRIWTESMEQRSIEGAIDLEFLHIQWKLFTKWYVEASNIQIWCYWTWLMFSLDRAGSRFSVEWHDFPNEAAKSSHFKRSLTEYQFLFNYT